METNDNKGFRNIKRRKCKYCKEWFVPDYIIQPYCCPDHAFKQYKENKKAAKIKEKDRIDKIKKVLLPDKLRRKADKLFQEVYTKGMCVACGKPANCVHHVIYKSQSKFLRYSPENAVPICNSCHDLHHKTGDSRILGRIIARYGIEWHNKLQKDRYNECEFTEEYLREVITKLEEEKRTS